ncbi:hypothetical protein GGS21DRAFT_10553 [Xylaria nigripes]|nr:hypothetical protein GGS21DRAFT_10553 [Xylaria nigripes]
MIFPRALAALSAWSSLHSALVDAGSIASWTTGGGAPQIVVQDDDTGDILYSLCNSNGTSVFPANESRSLIFDQGLAPKKGSSLAGIGFVNDQGIITTGMWYLNDDNAIVHALWKCNETGHLVKSVEASSQWIILDGKSVHPNTGLAAVNLGSENGYRVYYQESDFTTCALTYMPGFVNWEWSGPISQDPLKQLPITAGFSDPSAIVVVSPRDEENIEVIMQQADKSWVITSFPSDIQEFHHDSDDNDTNSPAFTINSPQYTTATNMTEPQDLYIPESATTQKLEAWDGKTRGIGLALNSDGSQQIFYVGSDSKIHCVSGANSWMPCIDVNINKWPTADNPNAQLAMAFDSSRNEIWVFYMSGGNLTQVHRRSKDKWEDPLVLPKTISSSATKHGQGRGGLSNSARAGIGSGAAIAGLALIILAVYIYLQRKKGKEEKRKADAYAAATQKSNSQASPATLHTSDSPEGRWTLEKWASSPGQGGGSGFWLNRASGQQVPGSPPMSDTTAQVQVHEMAHEVRFHEMAADGTHTAAK